MPNKKESKGRTKVYTDKVLEDIIEQYIIENPDVIKLIPNKIANFAREQFGFQKIRYTQFTSNKKIKKKIDEFNDKHAKIIIPQKENTKKFVKINTDALIDAYYNEPLKLKVALRQFGDKYTKVCRNNVEQVAEINNLKNDIKELEDKYKELKKIKAKETEKNKENERKVAHANRIEKFIRSIDVYNDLLANSKVDPMDEENLRLLLSNAGLLKESETVDIAPYLVDNVLDEGFDMEEFKEELESIPGDTDDTEEYEYLEEEDYLSYFENLPEE